MVFLAPASSSSSYVKLLTTDGSSVLCSGFEIIPLHFGSCSFDWLFQLALVLVCILRSYFLHHHNLFLDIANQKVFTNPSLGFPVISLTSSPTSSSSLCAALLSTPKCVSDLLLFFPGVLSSKGFTASPLRHQVCHQLLTLPGLSVFCQILPPGSRKVGNCQG